MPWPRFLPPLSSLPLLLLSLSLAGTCAQFLEHIGTTFGRPVAFADHVKQTRECLDIKEIGSYPSHCERRFFVVVVKERR